MTMYSYPKTKDGWWANVDEYWDDLYSILLSFLPIVDVGADIGLTIRLDKKVQLLKDNKDIELARYFGMAWARAPDDSSIHNIPSWHVLCDLCSEEYVLYEEGN